MEEKEKALEQLEEIRMSGRYNMMNLKGVMSYAEDNGMDELVRYVENKNSRYLELLQEL